MLMAQTRYARPDSLATAVAVLNGDPGARVLAGGQSLVNALKLRASRVDLLVDVSRLSELRMLERASDGGLVLGAGITYAEVASSSDVQAAVPVLAQVADRLVDRQVRARGTVGGNCCFNDPLSNLPPLFVALEARMRIVGSSGSREVAAEEFFHGPYRTAVAQGELLESVVVPPLPSDVRVGYQSLQIATDAWAMARAVVAISGDPIERARVVVGCVGPRPLRRAAVERALVGTRRSDVDAAALGTLASEDLVAVSDVHGSGAYRVKMTGVMTERAIREAIEGG